MSIVLVLMQGEGETKILHRLINAQGPAKFEPEHTHCIIGQDSDLILMTLMSSAQHLYILAEQNKRNRFGQRQEEFRCLSVDAVRALWQQQTPLSAGRVSSQSLCRTWIVWVSLLLLEAGATLGQMSD